MGKRGGAREGSGQPKFIVDYEACEKLASLMCTQAEIASFLGCSLSRLENDKEFQKVHRRGMDKGRMSLRRMQYRSAEEGNATMLVWLGKQHLGQRDKHEVENKGAVPVTIVDDIK